MSVDVQIPGVGDLILRHLLLDQNGTLSYRGKLIDGVAERIVALRERIKIHILTADTFGTLKSVTTELGVSGRLVHSGTEKREFTEQLGPEHCAAIGNGRNDREMLQVAGLAITVLGPEGLNTSAAGASDIVCPSITGALDLLLDERLLIATLRS